MNSLSGSNVKTSKLGVINQQYIYFNTTTGPTANVDVRRALQMAFDYDGALKSILQGAGQIATGPLPLGMSCEATFPAFKQDLAGAKALLAKAGMSGLNLTMRFQPDISDQAQEAVLFQSDLKKIGVNLTLSPITFAEYLKLLSNNSTIPQMILLADNAQIPSAGSFLTQFYGPNSAGSNRSGLNDPQVNALITAAAATSDETVQCDNYKKAQQIIHDAATAIDLFTIPWPLAYTSNLSGVDVSPTVTPISFATVRVS
ncbi:MAG: putative D,D-dipeptide-binding periplasmic protein ddpA [Pseudonocardiales bacterium]|nr:putative D,D-dipeptide-binding periplasmic protein ddpA [Pseudonocardiales bacterium]